MIFWFAGAITFSAIWGFIAYLPSTLGMRDELSIYNAKAMLALSLAMCCAGVAVVFGVRLNDLLHAPDFETVAPWYFAVGGAMWLAGAMIFNWVGVLKTGRDFCRLCWYSYLVTLAAWTVACIGWSAL